MRAVPLVAALLFTSAFPLALSAQSVADTPERCAYVDCALNVVPAWNGLAIVRGSDETRVGLLGFFRAGAISHVFAGDDAAMALADRALRTRQRAAVLTDAGALLLLSGAIVLAADERITAGSAALLGAGALSLGISVPLQFAADGHLSRAVWHFNRRFAAR